MLLMTAWATIAGAALSRSPLAAGAEQESRSKTAGAFYPSSLVQIGRKNAEKYPWAAKMRDMAVESARPWMAMSDEQLWSLMFGNTITRSWMVWSNGFCPGCKEGVPMYNWEIDALGRPWKVRCPHCGEDFPTNDFEKFYRSGLDSSGVFDPGRADRSLLFNIERSDPNDPLHRFGVDDGEGYVEDKNRWRFIGAFLVYGQWKQAVLGGIRSLAEAYVVTGDPVYAHKAGILLDRVADLYPTFDYKAQGQVYERALATGYVSVWHDACEETRELALAYDQVFEALRDDQQLITFLSRKAKQCSLANPKQSFADIQRNIEDRILRDALANAAKIQSNYPRAEIARAVIKTVLSWPDNRSEIDGMMDNMLKRATAVDGVTGEKGLANYSAFTIQSLAQFLGLYARIEPSFLDDLLKRHPRLHQTYRFHIDTWCCQKYYPLSGDSGWFAKSIDQYQGVRFQRPGLESGYSHKDALLSPSMFTFLWSLYQVTEDPAFVQALFLANDRSADSLPYDLFASDPVGLQGGVREVITREGTMPDMGSVNKEQWRIAILRSGKERHQRAVWLDYDSGGGHSHSDGMNLGLFAKGLDLMPDFGYPPVQFGGWGSPKATWYRMTAAHNTVVVDGRNHVGTGGKTTLWADGEMFHAIRASAPGLIGGKQFERTVVLVDVSERDGYVLDVFRVVGGTDHAKFQHSHFGTVETKGLSLKPTDAYAHGTQMRDFRSDPKPAAAWQVDWRMEDRYGLLPADSDVHLRYTDLTPAAEAAIAEGWIIAGGYSSGDEMWIPRVMVRRRSETGPLASTFVSVVEPYEKTSNIAGIRRLPLATPDGVPFGDHHVAVEISFVDGSRDVFVSVDIEDPLGHQPSFAKVRTTAQPDCELATDAELCLVRLDRNRQLQRIALCQGSYVQIGQSRLRLEERTAFLEVERVQGRWQTIVGDHQLIQQSAR